MRFFLFILVFLLFACRENTKPRITTHPKPTSKKVALVPIGNPEKTVVDSVKKSIENYYGFSVDIRKTIQLPDAFRSPRGPQRYRADSIIRYLGRRYTDVYRVIGITNLEISTTKRIDGEIKKPEWRYRDWGIFGLARGANHSCVVSYCYLMRREKNKMNERIRKITLHEIGHTLGLPHCPDKKCVMTDACETIKTVDNARPDLCATCKMILRKS